MSVDTLKMLLFIARTSWKIIFPGEMVAKRGTIWVAMGNNNGC